MEITIILTKNYKQSFKKVIETLKKITNVYNNQDDNISDTDENINTAIVSNNDSKFETLKSYLWKNEANIAFAYVDSNSIFADISPVICALEVEHITNSAKNLILYNKRFTFEELDKISTIKKVVVILDNKDIYNDKVNYLDSNINSKKHTIKMIQDDLTDKDYKQDDSNSSMTHKNESHNFDNNLIMEGSYDNTNRSNMNKGYRGDSASSNKNGNIPTVSRAASFHTSGGYRDDPDRVRTPIPKGNKVIVIFKPHIMQSETVFDAIRHIEKNTGVKLTYLSLKLISRQSWEDIYNEKRGESFYDSMCDYYSKDKVYVAIFEGNSAIEKVREIVGDTDPKTAGPNTVRKLFGLDKSDNGIHAPEDYNEHIKISRIIFR